MNCLSSPFTSLATGKQNMRILGISRGNFHCLRTDGVSPSKIYPRTQTNHYNFPYSWDCCKSVLLLQFLNEITERQGLDCGDFCTFSSRALNKVSSLGQLGSSFQVDLFSSLSSFCLGGFVFLLASKDFCLAL